ncbi:MAG: hypothetical protein LBC11_01065 [Puniceicoccales bacterium]|jgi:hypothetical protein|nr:hypothetical protein [Puniceicoccales bacterium]
MAVSKVIPGMFPFNLLGLFLVRLNKPIISTKVGMGGGVFVLFSAVVLDTSIVSDDK